MTNSQTPSRSSKRKGRSLQRQRALDVLFEADTKGIGVSGLSELLHERRIVSTSQQPIGRYGVEIIKAFVDSADNVDGLIEAASPSWSLDRMSIVDRNLLRIGATEITVLGVDRPVVIKEVTSLARDLSTDESVPFTMGVMNRVADIWELETSGSSERDQAEHPEFEIE